MSKEHRNEYPVRDNGVGIAAEAGERFLYSFQRFHDPNHFNGTRLGLAVARRIIQRDFASPGHGAAVYFTVNAAIKTAGTANGRQ